MAIERDRSTDKSRVQWTEITGNGCNGATKAGGSSKKSAVVYNK